MLLADALITGIPTDSWSLWFIHFIFEFLISALAIFLILLVLVQRGRGGGIAGALGGMGGNSAFGTKAGDTFTWITYVTAAIWIMLAMLTIKTFTDPHKDKELAQASQKEDLSDRRDVSGTGTEKDDNANQGKGSDSTTPAGGTSDKKTDDLPAKPAKEPAGESDEPASSEPKSEDKPVTPPSDNPEVKPEDKPDSEPKPEKPGDTADDDSK